MLMRYAKSFSQLCIAYHAIGKARRDAITTSFKKSFDNNVTMPLMFAPNTFRTPISFMRCEIANAERPNNPRHAMKIAIACKDDKDRSLPLFAFDKACRNFHQEK